MKKITKRITALIIAAMMLASMIPAAFATTGEETVKEKYEFKFTRASHDGAFVTKKTNGNLSYTVKDTTVDNTAVGYDKWGYVIAYKANNNTVYSDYLTFNYKEGDAEKAFLALEIDISEPGTYKPSLTWENKSNAPEVDIYLIKAPTDEATVNAWKTGNSRLSSLTEKDKLGTVKMQLTSDTSDKGDASPKTFEQQIVIVDGAEGSYYLIFDHIGASGAATSDTSSYYEMRPQSFSLTRVADDPITEAFEVTETTTGYTAPTAIGVMKDGTIIAAEDNEDGTFDLAAPDTNGTNKPFLYWALGLTGNKRIVSFDKTLTNYIPAEEGRNYLIAVYEGDVDTSKVEYYNQNGQLITDENKTVSLPGYGSTSKWVQYGTTNIYVADYEKTKDDRDKVTVTVENGTGGGTVPFGTEVTCTAAAKDGSGKPFKCWKKSNLDGDEIVSTDSTYKFKAWEDCTVTAVYEEHIYFGESMKIIIDSFEVGNDTGVMAEFIGLDNAVEKGIMFKATGAAEAIKIAMTTKDSQFTVIADKPGTYVGYAILKSGADAYTLITDGEYAK